MRRLICILVIAVLCSGCGVFRKVFKAKHSQSTELSSKSKKDSTGLIIDKSTTTIKEKIDTVITIPGQVVQQDTYLNMDSLVNGMTAIKNDLIEVRLHLNPITGILSVVANLKAQKVPVKLDRETTKQNDIVQQTSTKVENEDKSKQSSSASAIQKEPIEISGWLIGLGIVIFALLAVAYWLRKKMI
ncbi:DUF4381 domain-containing protein [Pedobacter nyackensis]|uniref:Uncharacterized protein n=1 Tax=Pedobacter nyackensis TaxID=475255 RepID=A0A1W1ZYK2_9SPHI|nr:DUF4381 domain-containing protein [Pedobacter nyackensis]SMC53474.1 hypothetical protein SAMN04488101_101161 [Pedobacter nyackensis]